MIDRRQFFAAVAAMFGSTAAATLEGTPPDTEIPVLPSGVRFVAFTDHVVGPAWIESCVSDGWFDLHRDNANNAIIRVGGPLGYSCELTWRAFPGKEVIVPAGETVRASRKIIFAYRRRK